MRLELMNQQLHDSSTELLIDTRESQRDILQDPQHPLFNLMATWILWLSEDSAAFHLHLPKGDTHGATLVGIHIGQQGLFELDTDFKLISRIDCMFRGVCEVASSNQQTGSCSI